MIKGTEGEIPRPFLLPILRTAQKGYRLKKHRKTRLNIAFKRVSYCRCKIFMICRSPGTDQRPSTGKAEGRAGRALAATPCQCKTLWTLRLQAVTRILYKGKAPSNEGAVQGVPWRPRHGGDEGI